MIFFFSYARNGMERNHQLHENTGVTQNGQKFTKLSRMVRTILPNRKTFLLKQRNTQEWPKNAHRVKRKKYYKQRTEKINYLFTQNILINDLRNLRNRKNFVMFVNKVVSLRNVAVVFIFLWGDELVWFCKIVPSKMSQSSQKINKWNKYSKCPFDQNDQLFWSEDL